MRLASSLATPMRAASLALGLLWAGPALSQAQPMPALPYTPHMVRTPDGLTIRAQEWGNPAGPAILFIHGYAQSSLAWQKQVTDPELARRFRMVTYDLRGHGMSDKPVGNEWYREGLRWADEVKAVIETVGLDRPVLVGWSYGGRVIGDFLAHHGQGGIGGINFVAATTSTAVPARFGPGVRHLAGMASEDLATAIEATVAFLRTCFERQPTQAEFEAMLAFNMMMPRHARIGLGGRAADYEAQWRSLSVPVLVTHGVKDAVVLESMGRFTQEAIPGAVGSFYEEVGHAPFWEDAPRFNRELIALMARAAR
jgi:non-heme chloroperoxidase